MIRMSLRSTVCLIALLAAGLFVVSFSTAFAANSVTNIQMSPGSPDVMSSGTNINITFDYETDESGGARVFFRPFTQGSLSPGYLAHGSSIYPVGTGVGTGWFTTNTDFTTVDQVWVQMFDSGQTVVLLEMFVSVRFYFGPAPVKDIIMTPSSPAALLYGDQVSITYNYETAEPGGVRIFPRPMWSGGGTSSASGSPNHPVGTGSGTGSFTINAPSSAVEQGALQPTMVDRVRFQILNDDQSYLIAEFFVPVSYTFDSTVSAEETTWGRIKALYSSR